MRAPLLVHLIFHPRSEPARALAKALHHALNCDAAVPGLSVPTVLAREDGTGLPPATYDLDEAERAFVIVLADDQMALDPPNLPPGRKTWSIFAGDLAEACRASHRFLPIQLSESAWPLDERLNETSFAKAHLQSEESRTAWVIRRVLVELSRFLLNEQEGNDLPVTLFLSHAKQDIARAPHVFKEICDHLQNTQPVKTWIDSAEIEGGSKFSEAIEEGVKDSVLLILATRSYSARTWCRRELLLAKRHGRPFVVVEALEGLDLRAFPYAGNAPRLRWSDGAAAQAVDLVLKETLRYEHVKLVLSQQAREGDVIAPVPPELSTVVRLPKGTTVLYPDPPLGDEENEEIAPLGLCLTTPLQRAQKCASLSKVPVLLSISESGDTERNGFFQAHLDAAYLEISRQLLARGASLEYGGHLGNEGYTVALFDMVTAYLSASGMPASKRVVNDVGWPLPLEKLPPQDRAKHQRVATYRRIPRPEGVADLEPATFVDEPAFFPATSAARRFAWARGMTAMREAQAGVGPFGVKPRSRARIVLGGKVGETLTVEPDGTRKVKWYSGRIPGVVEEILVSLRAGQPVYLLGAFGGAAGLAIDVLEGRDRPELSWEHQRQAPFSDEMRALYQARGVPFEDYPEMKAYLTTLGVSGLAKMNGLTEAENRELFTGRYLPRLIELLLAGLERLAPPQPRQGAT